MIWLKHTFMFSLTFYCYELEGWYDPMYGEIGNKCAWIKYGYQGAVSVATSLNNAGTYPVQAIWSNKNGVCTNVV